MELNELKNKNIIITGGSRGIGSEIIKNALANGANIVACNRSDDSFTGLKAEFKNLHTLRIDLNLEGSIQRFFDFALQTLGTIDIVICNAATSVDSLFVSLELEDWQHTLQMNLINYLLLSKYATEYFLKNKAKGHIVFLGSLATFGAPTNAAYSLTKGSLVGLCEIINNHYNQYNIYASTVIIGFVRTEMSANYPKIFEDVLINASPIKSDINMQELCYHILKVASFPEIFSNKPLQITGGMCDFPINFYDEGKK